MYVSGTSPFVSKSTTELRTQQATQHQQLMKGLVSEKFILKIYLDIDIDTDIDIDIGKS